MSPPLLPSFPLLTTQGTLPSPPPRPPSPYPRDPRTGNTIWSPTSQADHIRQRLKLVRLQHLTADPQIAATCAETALARQQVRYAALHAARQDKKSKDERARRTRWEDPDPFVSWETPATLPEDVFYRPAAPACVAVLSGVPNLAWGYGRVCMVHPLRQDPVGPAGKGIPVFAGEVGEGKGILKRLDPRAREDRTERFDLVRVERAVCFAAVEGRRDGRGRCLRCKVGGLLCSLERKGNWGKKKCEACRRNGCRFCLRLVWDVKTGRAEDDTGRLARYKYVRVRKTEGWRKFDVLVYVRDTEGEVDVEEVRRCAQQLVDGEVVSLWGTALNSNDRSSMALPSWKDGYCKSLTRKNQLDTAFVRRWRGDDGIREPEIDKAAVTWQDYFQLLDEKWRYFNPYMPREPRPRIQSGDRPAA
ncbi:hypothetical protein BR93DRAFT_935790 [Coniochaeta sp. PMI_546]|nr:hypothetical protein BR93DRAFT_935790 [Coniochaeta sp. PMI_546]